MKKVMIENNTETRNLLTTNDKCDWIDYLIAVGCGTVGGLIDIFLVGAPGDSKLQNWTDEQVNKAIYGFAKITGWKPASKETDDISHAIAALQRKYKVNYDQSVGDAASSVFGLTPDNHHMKSLGHSPDVIGLFFSILNQFSSTSTFFVDGRLMTMDTPHFELRGNTFISKIFFGFVNWFGHLASDFAGSSTSKGRGAGIVMPFFELFNACNFGNVSIDGEKGTVSDLAIKVYENGYDARFGITQSIPVVITDLCIRFAWAMRRRFQFKCEIKDCIPMRRYMDLRVMLLVGTGTLCTIDAVDAGVKSGGNSVAFFSRINMVGWCKLINMALIEVCIRIGINADFEAQVEAFRRVNQALELYLTELKNVDLDKYNSETQTYAEFYEQMRFIKDENSMNLFLKDAFGKLKLELPWEGEFDTFMNNTSNHLVFK